MEQPAGTVTLLFTDVEGSTRLLDQLGPERYRDSLELHRRLLRDAFARHDGYEVDYEGDAFSSPSGGPPMLWPRRVIRSRLLLLRIGRSSCESVCAWAFIRASRWSRLRNMWGWMFTRRRGSWPRVTAVRCSSRLLPSGFSIERLRCFISASTG
jgi:class 3 adenylate cyclase